MSKYRHVKKPSTTMIIIIALIALITVVVIVGAIVLISNNSSKENKTKETTVETVATQAQTDAPTEAPTQDSTEDEYTSFAKQYMSSMTDEEKIYQLLMVTPEVLTNTTDDVVTVAGDTTKAAIESYPVAGIVYSEQNFSDTEQTKQMLNNTKSYAKTPLFIAVSEEGGDSSPVASALDTTQLDAMSTYSEDGETVAFSNGDQIATDISKLGFNLNFAPTANLTGDNAYSTDPATAGSLVAQFMLAHQSNRVISVVSTFPDYVENADAIDNMRAEEFVPFVTAISKGADGIMVGNSKATAIDEEYPAFMSNRIVTEVLIKELRFDGVVFSPDLSSTSITDVYSTDDIVIQSFNAGVNVLVCPDDIDAYVTAIQSALSENKITQEQIDTSVEKILALKFKYGILDQSYFSVSHTGGADAPAQATDSEQ